MFVSVVIPCYNSAQILPELVERLNRVLPKVTIEYEIVLVVDGSPDRTWPVAERLAGTHSAVRAIRLARNYGQPNALVAGIREARHDVIVTMDDDLQHPPEEIPRLLAALGEDTDIVYGLASEEEHGVARSFASRSVKTAMSALLGVRHARSISSFRAFRAFLRGGFDGIHGPNVSIDVALSWAGARIATVRVTMDRRRVGRSGYTLRSLIRYAMNMFLGYSTAPLRLVSYLGFVVGAVGLGLLAEVLWTYFFSGVRNVEGFTSIASMVALFSAAQMLAIGVLGEYIGRIHASGMGAPTYVIRERRDSCEVPAQAPAEIPAQAAIPRV